MAAIAGYSGALVATSPPSVPLTNEALSNPSGDLKTFVESNAAHRYWDATQLFIVQVQRDAIQQISITGSPTGGSFTLTFGADTTAPLAWDATVAQVQAALDALADIGNGNVVCTGGPLPASPITVEFTGSLGYASQAMMTFTNSLTGGTTPTPVITVINYGFSWTTQSPTTYSAQYVGGIVTFTGGTIASSATVQVRLTNVSYFPWAVIADVTQWTFDGEMTFADATTMLGDGQGGAQAGAGWKVFQPLMLTGTFSVTKFWVPESQAGFAADITQGTLFIMSGVEITGNRYEGFCYAKKDTIKTDVEKLTDNSLDFQLSGGFYMV